MKTRGSLLVAGGLACLTAALGLLAWEGRSAGPSGPAVEPFAAKELPKGPDLLVSLEASPVPRVPHASKGVWTARPAAVLGRPVQVVAAATSSQPPERFTGLVVGQPAAKTPEVVLVKYVDGAKQTIKDPPAAINSDGPDLTLTVSIANARRAERVTVVAVPEDASLPRPRPIELPGPSDSDPTADLFFERPGTYQVTAAVQDKAGAVPRYSAPKRVQLTPVTSLPAPTIVGLDETFKVGAANKTYSVERFASPILLRSDQVQVRVSVPPLGEDKTPHAIPSLRLVNQKTGRDVVGKTDRPATTATLAPRLDPGENQLVAVLEKGWNRRESVPMLARVPEFRNPPAPVILASYSGTYAERQAVLPDQVITVYNSYLRLVGQNAPAGGQLRFRLFSFRDNDTSLSFLGELTPEVRRDDRGNWNAVLEGLPSLSRDKGVVLALADTGTGHNFSDVVLFQTAPVTPTTVQPPVLDKVRLPTLPGGAATFDPAKLYFSSVTSITVTGTGLKADTQVVVFLDGAARPIKTGVSTPGDKDGAWTVTVENLAEGNHFLTFATAQNGVVGPPSAPLRLSIRTRGPRVVGVEPPNFGTAPGVQTLVIQFDPADRVDPTTANSPANYRLVGSKGTGFFDRDLATPTSFTVQFDPGQNRALLKVSDPRPDIYQLTVFGSELTGSTDTTNPNRTGIKDVYGNPLEGQEGKPVTDFKVVLSKPEGLQPSDLPLETRGISGEPAPYVPFPEYTRFRRYPDGFNPSDKVDTRVARLYYFRDAHRVAQIINRKVKSYNYAAVAVRRRLADKARDLADTQTDERRKLQRQAEQAARDSREAERQLNQEQAALPQFQARGEQAGRAVQAVTLQRDQAQALVATLKQQLDTATDANRQTINAQLIQAQQNLTSLNATLDQAIANNNVEAKNFAAAQERLAAAAATLQAKRTAEVAANEQAQQAAAKEERFREEQFRREVAAAHEDPDTYAPGKPDSDDPVEQVSVSVIGEGEIQLRGPIKGLNVIRTIINQIDAPVGQVRVAVHTVQVNGEHGDRMEKVVARIQRYIDHSRFLTTQSAQMLRKAVVLVASRKAAEVNRTSPHETQEFRDQKYLYAFFGKDFIDELQTLDSEFLKTGNKLLSLHSMDTTSLASALFVLALAKNSTRLEILQEFERMLQQELPVAEQDYFAAGISGKEHGKFQLLADNARFQSFRGFFNAEVAGDDTLNPIQREFIRLAQIFKSRLVTELELKQRVMERAVIEEKLGNYIEELKAIRLNEKAANDALTQVQTALDGERPKLLQAFTGITAEIAQFIETIEKTTQIVEQSKEDQNQLKQLVKQQVDALPKARQAEISKVLDQPLWVTQQAKTYQVLDEAWSAAQGPAKRTLDNARRLTVTPRVQYGSQSYQLELDLGNHLYFPTAAKRDEWNQWVDQAIVLGKQLEVLLLPAASKATLVAILEDVRQLKVSGDSLQFPEDGDKRIDAFYAKLSPIVALVRQESSQIDYQTRRLVGELSADSAQLKAAYAEWLRLRQRILTQIQGTLLEQARPLFNAVDKSFSAILQIDFQRQAALRKAEESRRPLDHKKFLDMLVDDIEDKYIELLEGTRAHTANIDNYIKQLSTALDDDFNTQFYYPAFRHMREASRMWDVTLGQVETTSILTNNRAFAKVSPQATMEFDLPKRDILIAEAMQVSQAMVNQYGALLQDPNFLSVAKLRSGQPPSSPVQGAADGLSVVRNVLPVLPSSTAETVLSQGGPGRREQASPLEALIPDPAIYQFETGTGYEIRPVISPDGQNVVFHFNYMYTTNVREPVRADEKHLGRVKRHFIDTDVQLSNYELREVSRYVVGLKAARTARGIPLLQDIPGLGILFRPLPSAESSLQENIILGQATIFPTLFDLMGLRWAPAVADLDALRTVNDEFVVRSRHKDVSNRVFDYSTSRVDEFLRIPPAERRTDLYRSQETIPHVHPNGYYGPGLNLRDSHLREGYDPRPVYPEPRFVPGISKEGVPGASAVPPGGVPGWNHDELPGAVLPYGVPQPATGVPEGMNSEPVPADPSNAPRRTLPLPGSPGPNWQPPRPGPANPGTALPNSTRGTIVYPSAWSRGPQANTSPPSTPPPYLPGGPAPPPAPPPPTQGK
ncbi:MAG: hypothetical protein HYS12_00735 [Planctomycetes bacterium]|nr:hypothetical protein [Planctomycetota bacterium]